MKARSTRNAGLRLVGGPQLSAVGRGRGATRSFDDCAHAALEPAFWRVSRRPRGSRRPRARVWRDWLSSQFSDTAGADVHRRPARSLWTRSSCAISPVYGNRRRMRMHDTSPRRSESLASSFSGGEDRHAAHGAPNAGLMMLVRLTA